MKWGISIANIADFTKPTEQISYPQQLAVMATGLIWSRFATQIIPVRALPTWASMMLQVQYNLTAFAGKGFPQGVCDTGVMQQAEKPQAKVAAWCMTVWWTSSSSVVMHGSGLLLENGRAG